MKNSTFLLNKFSGRSTPTLNQVIENCQFLTFKVNFLSQNYLNLSNFFFIEEYQFKGTFLVIDIFWKLQSLNHFIFSEFCTLIEKLRELIQFFPILFSLSPIQPSLPFCRPATSPGSGLAGLVAALSKK